MGGKTVFPTLGFGVDVTKGAGLFWFNRRLDGSTDHLMAHGACPTLLGWRFIGSKWIHYQEQWRNFKCSLRRGDRVPVLVNGKVKELKLRNH